MFDSATLTSIATELKCLFAILTASAARPALKGTCKMQEVKVQRWITEALL